MPVEVAVVDWQQTALTNLTSAASLAACQAADDSFFYDATAETLSVHWSGGDDPTGHHVAFGFWLYFSMGGEGEPAAYAGVAPDSDTQDYHPYLLGVPDVVRQNPADTSGLPVVSSGTIRLASPQSNPQAGGANGPGVLDRSVTHYFWIGAEARVLFCGDVVPASEFLERWRGTVTAVDWQRGELTLTCEDTVRLLDQVTRNPLALALDFTTGTIAHTSTPLPICIGECHDVQAVLIEESTLMFCAPGHRCASIEVVRVNGEEVIPLCVSRDATTPAGCGLYVFLGEQYRDAVVKQQAVVTVDLVGMQYPAGHAAEYRPITNAIDVAYYLLNDWCGVGPIASGASGTFAAQKYTSAGVHVALSIPSPIPAREALAPLFASVRAACYGIGGTVQFNTLYNDLPRPDEVESVVLEDIVADVQDIKVRQDGASLFYRTDIAASPAVMAQSAAALKQAQVTNLLAQLASASQESFQISSTAIENERQAAFVAQLYRVWAQLPQSVIELLTTKRAFPVDLRTILRLTSAIAPDASAWNGRLMRVTSIACTLGTATPTARLQMIDCDQHLVKNYGTWRSAETMTWATASASDKALGGFWCDDNGYCDPTDPASLLASLWA